LEVLLGEASTKSVQLYLLCWSSGILTWISKWQKKKGYHSTHFKIFKVKDNKQINNIVKNFWKTQWEKTSSNHYRNQDNSKQNSKDDGTNWIKDGELLLWTHFCSFKTTLAYNAKYLLQYFLEQADKKQQWPHKLYPLHLGAQHKPMCKNT